MNQQGYNHLTINHSVEFVTNDGVHTQLIESLWSQVKSMLKVKRGTRKHHLPGYLDLYSFQCDCKHININIVDAFIDLIQVDEYY